MEYLDVYDIDGWCAGKNVSGLTADVINKYGKSYIISKVLAEEGSVILVTVNETETEVIEKLKEWGFTKGKWFKNWGHGGRRTCIYTYQISKQDWEDAGNTVGSFDNWEYY